MNDMAQKISEVVAQSLAAGQAEVATLLDKVRDDIEALHRAVGTLPGSAQQPVAKRSPVATGRPRRKKAEAAGSAVAPQSASGKTPTKRTRREKTPEEREAISKRMSAYWQRKREDKAAGRN